MQKELMAEWIENPRERMAPSSGDANLQTLFMTLYYNDEAELKAGVTY